MDHKSCKIKTYTKPKLRFSFKSRAVENIEQKKKS